MCFRPGRALDGWVHMGKSFQSCSLILLFLDKLNPVQPSASKWALLIEANSRLVCHPEASQFVTSNQLFSMKAAREIYRLIVGQIMAAESGFSSQMGLKAAWQSTCRIKKATSPGIWVLTPSSVSFGKSDLFSSSPFPSPPQSGWNFGQLLRLSGEPKPAEPRHSLPPSIPPFPWLLSIAAKSSSGRRWSTVPRNSRPLYETGAAASYATLSVCLIDLHASRRTAFAIFLPPPPHFISF